jgi:N-acetylmuramoyl-L-alanine amidase
MTLKTTLNYSPNFNPQKRNSKKIKFIIFHYTGMKKESQAISRLTNIQSEVSCHYLIKNSGQIVKLVPDLYIAWHAGKSSWRSFKSLNKNSIGIEITNPGHEFNYKKFSKKQIFSILELSKFLIKKYNIDKKNILGHSDIAPERKKDPGEKFPWKYLYQNKVGLWHSLKKKELIKNRRFKTSKIEKEFFFNNLFKIGYSKKTPKNLNKDRYLRDIIKTFQRRFRQELIDGKIDRECSLISENLLKRYN